MNLELRKRFREATGHKLPEDTVKSTWAYDLAYIKWLEEQYAALEFQLQQYNASK